MSEPDVDRLLADQIRYYDDRAPIYEDLWFRRGSYDRGPAFNAAWFGETAIVEAAVDALEPSGSVLELACGSGLWTRRLAPDARRYLAVDAAPAMLALNAERTADPKVEYVRADLFEWEPSNGERFDLVFFGFFISHVPPVRFADCWERARRWLAPNGTAAFVDDRAGSDRPYSGDVVRDGPEFAHRRRLPDGREYTIVKVFYGPAELAAKLEALGWEAEVRASGAHFLYGTARPG